MLPIGLQNLLFVFINSLQLLFGTLKHAPPNKQTNKQTNMLCPHRHHRPRSFRPKNHGRRALYTRDRTPSTQMGLFSQNSSSTGVATVAPSCFCVVLPHPGVHIPTVNRPYRRFTQPGFPLCGLKSNLSGWSHDTVPYPQRIVKLNATAATDKLDIGQPLLAIFCMHTTPTSRHEHHGHGFPK